MTSNWHNASRSHRCPVCGHDSWCSYLDNGEVVVCRRVESPHPTKSGIGWIHFLRDTPARRPYFPAPRETRVRRDAPSPSSGAPLPSVAERFAALRTPAGFLARLAARLGVPERILADLDVRCDARGNAVFPMRAAGGTVTGGRVRDLATGRKWSVRGSRDGLFFPDGFQETTHDELVVLEGPSDTAAALAAGLPAVGRSSCLTGGAQLETLVRLCRVRRVTIVADLDAPKRLPNGRWWRPGIDGAKALRARLSVCTRCVTPPPGIKDFRDWRRIEGMCRWKFAAIAREEMWKVPVKGGAS